MPTELLPEPLADYADRLLAGTDITAEQARELAASRGGDYPSDHPVTTLRAGWHASTDDLPLTLDGPDLTDHQHSGGTP